VKDGEAQLLYVPVTVHREQSVKKEYQQDVEQQPSQCSHPQRSTTVPQTATSNTTSKYTPYAVTRGLFS